MAAKAVIRFAAMRERFTVSRKRWTALSSCFDAIPKGKRFALFPRKPLRTFLGIALAAMAIVTVPASAQTNATNPDRAKIDCSDEANATAADCVKD
ncbi:MAG: hypothetical protein E5W88_32930, partial [Mesorhizobium sp.]